MKRAPWSSNGPNHLGLFRVQGSGGHRLVRERRRRPQRAVAVPDRLGRPVPSTRVRSFCGHPLSIHIETPTEGRGGCSRMTALSAMAGATCPRTARTHGAPARTRRPALPIRLRSRQKVKEGQRRVEEKQGEGGQRSRQLRSASERQRKARDQQGGSAQR